MAITLPLPVRVAAGLLATGIDLVRSLPDDIPAIPVTLVGNAMRLSIKVQQEIATLATRGDELLGGVIGAPQENPAWARFDDDEPITPTPKPKLKSAPKPAAQTPFEKASTTKTPATRTPTSRTPTAPATAKHPTDPETPASAGSPTADPGGTGRSGTEPAGTEPAGTKPAGTRKPGLATPIESAIAPVTTTAMEAAVDVPAATIEQAMVTAGEPAPNDDPAHSQAVDKAAAETVPQPATEQGSEPSDAVQDPPAADGPAALPGYDRMTLAQVRGHLRELSAADVAGLLQFEQANDNRAPFLTLLSNRLVTLDAQNP